MEKVSENRKQIVSDSEEDKENYEDKVMHNPEINAPIIASKESSLTALLPKQLKQTENSATKSCSPSVIKKMSPVMCGNCEHLEKKNSSLESKIKALRQILDEKNLTIQKKDTEVINLVKDISTLSKLNADYQLKFFKLENGE